MFSSKGFTLIEVMIVVVIMAILTVIAVPNYRQFVVKSQRTDAHNALMQAAANQEKHFIQNNSYAENINDMSQYAASPAPSSEGYYSLAVTSWTSTSFVITATNVNANDDKCLTLTINQAGTVTASDSGGASNTDTCWGR